MSEKRFRFPLDIQNFADGDGDGGGSGAQATLPSTSQSTTQATTIDYDRIADIIGKRSSSAEDTVLKGYFKQQGLSPEEATQAMEQYKQTRATKKTEQETAQKRLEEENAQLKAQIQNASIEAKIAELSNTLGVQAEKVPFLNKLVDHAKAMKEDGVVDEENIKSSIEEVLKTFPDFKTKKEAGFTQVGSSGSGSNEGTETDSQLDVIFGIKK